MTGKCRTILILSAMEFFLILVRKKTDDATKPQTKTAGATALRGRLQFKSGCIPKQLFRVFVPLRVQILYGVLYLVPLCDQCEANRPIVIGRGFWDPVALAIAAW
ncbi:MAG: hypothetical protein OXD38_04030, partial [Aestuariivita sp.]|nr:hypothetical protein [Aestuariivita sp.]